MNGFQMVWHYAFRSRKEMIITIVFMIIGSMSAAIVPRLTELIINGITDLQHPISRTELFVLIGLGVAGGLASAILNGVGRYYSAIVGTQAVYFVRKDVYDAINRQSFSFFDSIETGQLISRATSDIEMTQQAFGMGITFMIQVSVSSIVILVAVQLTVPSLSWILYLTIAVYLLIVKYFAGKMAPLFYKSRIAFGDLTITIRENILGAQVVRIFNAQNKELSKFAQNNEKFKQYTVGTIKYQTLLMNFSKIFLGILIIFILYVGGRQVINGRLNVGTLIAFLTYATMISMPLFMLNNVIQTFIQADASFKRVSEILQNLGETIEKPDAVLAENIKGEIIFENVSFKYSETPVLDNISFQVNPGEKIAILGTTGSGKSTLVSLIPRYYDPTLGEIKLDGRNLRDYQLNSLRKNIGVVSQEIFLFTNSIKDNIRFGKEEASDEEVIEAAKSANIHDFIISLPEGYNTIIGERGVQLSGGQKQRLAIARALIINPRILILDDSTSAVDVETERKIQQSLATLMENRTSFIITQRLSTIRNVDRIMVLDRGHLVGFDSHKALYESNALYKQMYETLFMKQKTIESKTIESKTIESKTIENKTIESKAIENKTSEVRLE